MLAALVPGAQSG